jgi:hypothetical protein
MLRAPATTLAPQEHALMRKTIPTAILWLR